MAANDRHGRFGPPPSSNGDPFQAFVIRELRFIARELEANSRNWAEQRRWNRDQERVNDRILLLLDHLLKRTDRQDRINRLTLKEFKSLRRRLR